MVAGVLASLAELELELGRERRAAAREARRARGQNIGRPKALDESKARLARRMYASGESAGTIANPLGVSRATVYRVLAAQPTKAGSSAATLLGIGRTTVRVNNYQSRVGMEQRAVC